MSPGIGLAADRAVEQRRHLPVRHRVLGQVVVDDERVAAAVHEVLAERARGVRRQVAERRHVARAAPRRRPCTRAPRAPRASRRPGARSRPSARSRSRCTTTSRALLREDRVDRERGLADLAVADDELALPASDRHERVDRPSSRCAAARRPDAGRRRPGAGRSTGIHAAGTIGSPSVDRTAQRVHDPPEHALAGRHLQQMPGAADVAAFSHAVLARRAGRRRPDCSFSENARPSVPPSNSTISWLPTSRRPVTMATPSPIRTTLPVSSSSSTLGSGALAASSSRRCA